MADERGDVDPRERELASVAPLERAVAQLLEDEGRDEIQHTVRHRVLRYFHCHGLLAEHVTDDMLTWQASGGFSDGSVLSGRQGVGRPLRAARSAPTPPTSFSRAMEIAADVGLRRLDERSAVAMPRKVGG